jgi:hypothetical protein
MATVHFDGGGNITEVRMMADSDVADQGVVVVGPDIAMSISPLTHYVSGGKLIPYDQDQRASKSLRRPGCRWENSSMSWRPDGGGADLARDQKRFELKMAREAAIVTPKMTSLGLFDSAPGDQDNLAKVIKLTEIAASKGYPAVARYTRGDNVRMEFTLDELYTVALELGSANQPIFDTYDQLRTQLDAAETIEQIEAIQWPTS